MKDFLPSQSFPLFFELLASFGEIHGPRFTEDRIVAFGPLGSAEQFLSHYSRTLLPPKKYLLPPKEDILIWNDPEGYRLPEIGHRRTVLLGIHQCDLAAIAYLDRVFLSTVEDPGYAARRESLTLVGITCEPDEYCFCASDETCHAQWDLFLHVNGEGFFLSTGSCKGEEIAASARHLVVQREFSPPPAHEAPEFTAIKNASVRGETFSDSPLWTEFAHQCLSCGACSLCCPTCYCFDVREYPVDATVAVRVRDWDNCLFRSHGEVAGGVNFRSRRTERFRYRYQHKYLGFGPTRGIVSCVGCGRCREVCPVRIDLLRLFEDPMREEGRDRMSKGDADG